MEVIDKSNMHKVIAESPEQLERGLALAKNIKVKGYFKNFVICGMGGSALPGDILRSLNKINQIYIHRDYGLPMTADENSLIICVSYSGNTEELVSALEEALKKKLKIICIASGEKVEEICKKNNIPLVKVPGGIEPRSATGYIFSALVKTLENSGIVKNMSPEILKTARKLKKINISLEEEGKELAKNLFKKIPVVYASNQFKIIAKIWKIKFNENAKIPAFYNYFPELNHNEMAGYTKIKNQKLKIKNFCAIILKDAGDNSRILKRMELTAKLLSKNELKVEFINIEEGSLLFKIFSSLLLGDWTSYYLALEYKTDPTPVKMVEELKKLMRE